MRNKNIVFVFVFVLLLQFNIWPDNENQFVIVPSASFLVTTNNSIQEEFGNVVPGFAIIADVPLAPVLLCGTVRYDFHTIKAGKPDPSGEYHHYTSHTIALGAALSGGDRENLYYRTSYSVYIQYVQETNEDHRIVFHGTAVGYAGGLTIGHRISGPIYGALTTDFQLRLFKFDTDLTSPLQLKAALGILIRI